jgi:Skp family chaperone for outer membrane proteins
MKGAAALVVGGFLLGASLVAGAAPAVAQTPAGVPGAQIIIVDITQILRESKAAKDVQAQLDRETVAYSKEVSRQENELQKIRDDLERQRTVLSPDAFTAKTREYQQRFDTLDKSVQVKRQGLQQSYNDAMGKVESAALQIIADLAKERGANLVLAKAAVMFEAAGLDVTAEAIVRLDQKLPSVPVSLPKEGDGAAPKGKAGPKN